MSSRVADYAADHRHLLDQAARAAGLVDPVAVHLDEFHNPLIKAARRGAFLPLNDVLIRDWDPNNRRTDTGVQFGCRLYAIAGVCFVHVEADYHMGLYSFAFNFIAVARRDYARLYRIARRCLRDSEPAVAPPIMPDEQRATLWRNTIGYLEPRNLRRIKNYGGRARRGVLLTGPPGNGKTSACRRLWQECRRRNWEWHLVTPDAYAEARRGSEPQKAVRELFQVEKSGIVFFDDMDLALRDRETAQETDDQAVFLGALDGIEINEGVVFVFTTNCSLDLIDRAFKRPGRIDLVLQFDPPTTELRHRLLTRWHADIRGALDADRFLATTAGLSFAEIDELKNLLILRFTDAGEWDWDWALAQMEANRSELAAAGRFVGFDPRVGTNGSGHARAVGGRLV
jgi:cell division protease FtsH